MTSAVRYKFSASKSPASAVAVENCVPFNNANPSLGPSDSGTRPAWASAASAGIRSPATKISPTPIIVAVRCDKGARSPEAPTEPCDGITGVRPWARKASSIATVEGLTPDAPCARLANFSAIISRTVGTDIGLPTGRVRKHEVALERLQVMGIDANGCELAEPSIDAVDGSAFGDDRRHRGRAPFNKMRTGRSKRSAGSAIDLAPLGQGDLSRLQKDVAHRTLHSRRLWD